MKKTAILSLLASSLLGGNVLAQSSYTLKMESSKLVILTETGEESFDVPFSETESDTLSINDNRPQIESTFKSDIESRNIVVKNGETVFLNLIKEGYPAFVLRLRNGIEVEPISFDTESRASDISFWYEDDVNSPYMTELRSKYPIDSIANLETTSIGKVRRIASWVHGLWEHNGWNEPEKSDAISILEEVKNGKQFRCVEYGIVTAAALNSIGIKSRPLGLKTQDVETRKLGAGHVTMEAYLPDLQKWVMIDSQFDAIPHIGDTPLNAVELQEAITTGADVQFWSGDEGFSAGQYSAWIYPYLYYFDVKFDNRENVKGSDRKTIEGHRSLMLVPKGAKNPTVFQVSNPITYCIYSPNLLDFYAAPN